MLEQRASCGFTQIPNDVLERLMRTHLSPNQWQVVLCLVRKTYGFHKAADRISNTQIEQSTGLVKTVVSRALANLAKAGVIFRERNEVGLRTSFLTADAPSPVSNIANTEELAVLSTGLAEPSTAVSSFATQVDEIANRKLAELLTTKESKEILTKENTTKDTGQKKGGRRLIQVAAETGFEAFVAETKKDFPDLDCEVEYRRFTTWWSEGRRQLVRPKSAWLNWLLKARQIAAESADRQTPVPAGARPAPARLENQQREAPAWMLEGLKNADSQIRGQSDTYQV